MADPHNPARYGELWPAFKVSAYKETKMPPLSSNLEGYRCQRIPIYT